MIVLYIMVCSIKTLIAKLCWGFGTFKIRFLLQNCHFCIFDTKTPMHQISSIHKTFTSLGTKHISVLTLSLQRYLSYINRKG